MHLIKRLGMILTMVILTGCNKSKPPFPSIEPARKPAPGIVVPNNTWVSRNPDADTVVVFVHGIFSASQTCWFHAGTSPVEDAYWPRLLTSDQSLAPLSVFCGGYYTASLSGKYDLNDCADELHRMLNRKQTEGRILEHPKIIFVAHSTGGIVVRKMLLRHLSDYAGKKIGVFLVASPALGSKYADWLRLLADAANNDLARRLQTDDPTLADLDSNFRELAFSKNPVCKLIGKEIIENRFIGNAWWANHFAEVVPRESQGNYFGNPQRIAGTNHFTVAAPSNQKSPSHIALQDFINEYRKTYYKRTDESSYLELESLLDDAATSLAEYTPKDLTLKITQSRPLMLSQKARTNEEYDTIVNQLKSLLPRVAFPDGERAKATRLLARTVVADRSRVEGLQESEYQQMRSELFGNAVKMQESIARYAFLRGRQLERASRIEDAIALYQEATEALPNANKSRYPLVMRLFGVQSLRFQNLRLKGERAKAQEAFQDVLQTFYTWLGMRPSDAEPVYVWEFLPDQDGDHLPEEWKLWLTTFGKYSVEPVHDTDVGLGVTLKTSNSSIALFQECNYELETCPWLSWRWRVDKLPEKGDCRKKETDDQAAQVIAIIMTATSRQPILMQYSWDSKAPVGTVVRRKLPQNFPVFEMRYCVIRSQEDPVGEWVSETRNVLEDFRQVSRDLGINDQEVEAEIGADDTGIKAKVIGIVVQNNTQHSKGEGIGLFGRIISSAERPTND